LAVVGIFDVVSEELNVVKISTSGNYAHIWITKWYDFPHTLE